MDFTLDRTNWILHVSSEAFDNSGFAINMFNNYFLEYLKEFFIGKHIKSMTEFITRWDNIKDEFGLFMNLRFLGYALSM